MAVKSLVLLNIFQAFKVGYFEFWYILVFEFLENTKWQMNYYSRVRCSITVTEFSVHRVTPHKWGQIGKNTPKIMLKKFGILTGHMIVMGHDGRFIIIQNLFLGEHKLITLKQKFLCIVLCFLCIQNGRGYCVSLRNTMGRF